MASTTPSTADAAGTNSSHPFTCNSCQVAFRSSELQRTHMQTDWHRYNLKRRVATLPPLSSEVFAEKVLANKATAAASAAKASFEKTCAACQKTYFSENAYQNHLGSQKHRQNVMSKQRSGQGVVDDDIASVKSSTFSLGEPIPSGETAAGDGAAEAEFSEVVNGIKNATLGEGADLPARRPSRPHHSSAENRPEHPISRTDTESAEEGGPDAAADAVRPPGPLLECLFCNFASPTFPLNVQHMERYHGMFIPERDYLVDLEGLVDYLHGKIHQAHQCLYCDKLVHTAAGIQTHMRDRGHCMIAFETDEQMVEIGEFYDFTSTYSDAEEDTASEQGGVKLDGEPQNEDGWETDSTISDVPTDEITSVPIDDRSHRYKLLDRHRHHSHSDPRSHRYADGFHSHAHPTPHAVYHDEYEMHLPSGRSIGHRSLNRYFKQNLRNYPSAEERAEQLAITAGASSEDESTETPAEARERGRQVAVSRANGGLGMVGVTDTQKKQIAVTEKRERKREERERNRYQWGKDKRNNHQKHYRDPLLQ